MKFPKLTNGQYDRIKQFLLMVVPAATSVITGIGVMNGFSTEKITGSCDRKLKSEGGLCGCLSFLDF